MEDKFANAPRATTADDVAWMLWTVLRTSTDENRAKQLKVFAECRRAAFGIGEFDGKETDS